MGACDFQKSSSLVLQRMAETLRDWLAPLRRCPVESVAVMQADVDSQRQ